MANVYHCRSTDYYDIFAEYVLESTTPDALREELRKWLKPNVQESGLEHELYKDQPTTEFTLPDELTKPSLLVKAEAFCTDERFRKLTIVQGVGGQIPYFFIPALGVYLCRTIWGLVSNSSPSKESPFQIACRWALNWSIVMPMRRMIWTLPVLLLLTVLKWPLGRIERLVSTVAALCSPSGGVHLWVILSHQEQKMRIGTQNLQGAYDEMRLTRRLVDFAVKERQAAAIELSNSLDQSTTDNIEEYRAAIVAYQRLQERVVLSETANDAASKSYELALGRARSMYEGEHAVLGIWAPEMSQKYTHLLTNLAGVCLVGAGLTYASIFSAVRGNLGLMCWAFSLFITALWIFVTIQCILGWATSPKAQYVIMLGPRMWHAIVKLSFAAGITAVTASFILLLVTIAQLRFNIQGEYQNPNAANWDAKLIFTIAPRPSSYLAFVFLGTGIVIVLYLFMGLTHLDTVHQKTRSLANLPPEEKPYYQYAHKDSPSPVLPAADTSSQP